jgi:hypothetical protein
MAEPRIANNIGGTTICDGSQYSRIDLITGAIESIDYAHHEVHAGTHFFYTDSVTIASGSSQTYMMTVPNTTKWPHMIIHLDGTAVTSLVITEAADRDGTAEQTVFNNDRNSATTATMKIHKGVSGGTTNGTTIFTHASGTATNQSRDDTATGNGEEIILKQNTKYLLIITSGTNGNLVNVRFEWYEHTNKAAITLV